MKANRSEPITAGEVVSGLVWFGALACWFFYF